MRLQGPVKLISRTAMGDHSIGGVDVPAGSVVMVAVDAANADPRRWDDPERLDLARKGPGNLGFGAGIHFCLGSTLARIEAEETLVRLFRRFPALTLAGAAPVRESSTFRALESLPVRLG
jgi:cytochrome P450